MLRNAAPLGSGTSRKNVSGDPVTVAAQRELRRILGAFCGYLAEALMDADDGAGPGRDQRLDIPRVKFSTIV
jgi:hypothetical protein